MLRIILTALLLTSCSMGVTTKGGKKSYEYLTHEDYDLEKLRGLAPKVIRTSFRQPPVSSLEKLFAEDLPDLKRIGIIVFESKIQETRSGLASQHGKIYPTASGKQLMTEMFLNVWDEGLPIVDPKLEYVPSARVKEGSSLHRGGAEVEDHIKSPRETLAAEDLKVLEKGRATATQTILNPRGMRDLSFVLVPAAELMGGPKWSEHQKFIVNEVVKELKLDAALVIMSTVQWDASHREQISGDQVPEQMILEIEASTVIPFSRYHERLKLLGQKEEPMVTLTYRHYQGSLRVPVNLSMPPDAETFESIKLNLLNPLFVAYRDLALMTMTRMRDDWKKTR